MASVVPKNWPDFITDTTDLDQVWQLFRNQVKSQVLQTDAIVIPWLSESSLYNLNCVIVKLHENIAHGSSRTGSDGRIYAPIGPLEGLTSYRSSEYEVKCRESYEVPQYSCTQEFKYDLTGGIESHDRKEVHLYIDGYRKMISAPLLPDEIHFDFSKIPLSQEQPMKSAFIIHETYFTPRLHLAVKVSGRRYQRTWSWLPIGFNMVKYKIMDLKTGKLGPVKKVIRAKDCTAQFIKEREICGRSVFYDELPPPIPAEFADAQKLLEAMKPDSDSLNRLLEASGRYRFRLPYTQNDALNQTFSNQVLSPAIQRSRSSPAASSQSSVFPVEDHQKHRKRFSTFSAKSISKLFLVPGELARKHQDVKSPQDNSLPDAEAQVALDPAQYSKPAPLPRSSTSTTSDGSISGTGTKEDLTALYGLPVIVVQEPTPKTEKRHRRNRRLEHHEKEMHASESTLY